METDLLSAIKLATIGRSGSVTRLENGWNITFGGGLAKGGCRMFVDSPWRIVKDGKIRHTSDDDGQKFGLPKPVDAEREANAHLRRRKVTEFEIDRATSDIRVEFAGGVRLEILTVSAGYEAWSARFSLDGQDITLVGGAQIFYAAVPSGESPSSVAGKPLP